MRESLAIQAELVREEDAVRIAFRIVNPLAVDLFLIDFGVRVQGGVLEFHPKPMRCQIASDMSVTLSSTLPPFAPNVRRAAPVSTFARQVSAPPFSGSISHPLPLVDSGHRDRYRADGGVIPPDSAVCRHLGFQLGVIEACEELVPERCEIEGTEVFQIGPAAWKHQLILEARFSDVELPILGYDLTTAPQHPKS